MAQANKAFRALPLVTTCGASRTERRQR
jgi:hypothetical protein